MSETRSTRRTLLKAGALTGAALFAARARTRVAHAEEDDGAFPLRMAGYTYDRVAALADGRVGVPGCKVTYEPGRIGDMNTHLFSGPKTREVSEVGLMPYLLAFANHDFRDYRLLPVFPLRTFRHKSIFIRTDRGIEKPEDLKGKRIATPGYSSTSLTWIRGLLQHAYGVTPKDVRWVLAAKDSSAKASGGASAMEKVLPKGLTLENGPAGKDESQLLVDGDVDALFHAAEPKAYREGHPKVARLFADSRAAEQAWYRDTGIFPVMHAVAVRADLVESRPALLRALFDAYAKAKQLVYDDIRNRQWYMHSLPWIGQEAEATRALMGDNWWPYGIKPNRKSLEALLTYAHEQGLAKRRVTIEELFPEATLAFED